MNLLSIGVIPTIQESLAKDDRPTCPLSYSNDSVNSLPSSNLLLEHQTTGLVEKSRDMGATWLACAFSIWLWIFYPGASIGWGSRKEQLVDNIGDPDSIFEKMRMLIRNIPRCFLPEGFTERSSFSFMRIINQETGSTITW